MTTTIKHVGILLSYCWLLVAYYLFEWSATGIMFSYMIEIAVLAVIYEFLEIVDLIKNKTKSNRKIPSGNKLAATVAFLFIQGLVIFITLNGLESDVSFDIADYFSSAEIYFTIAGITIFYIIDALSIKNDHRRIVSFQSSFLLKVLLLFSANLIGLILVYPLQIETTAIVVVVMVVIRIAIEFVLISKSN